MICAREKVNKTNAVVRTYSWGPEAQGAPGTLRMITDSNGVYFPAYDPNGNVMGLVKASDGTVYAQYEYLPYGKQVTATGTMASSNPIRFSTKYRDNETDLYYYGYRYYSPSLGRWISRDPIDEQGGLNLYGFVNNDPVNKWDKLGFFWGKKKNNNQTNPYAEHLKNSTQELCKSIISSEGCICSKKQKAVAKIGSYILLFVDAKSSIEDMEYVANTCVNFAKSPSVASCYACCYKIVNSFPLIGIFAHFECTNICSNF